MNGRSLSFAAIACGCAALALRSPGTVSALAATVTVGALGLVATGSREERTPAVRWLVATVLGMLAFAVARSLMRPEVATPFWLPAVVGSAVAAVAEEAFFRRLVFDALARWGSGVAIVGAAVAFTAVHVPAYGWGVLPIDLTAGLLFGWQRWATGGWSAPACTHVVANLLQVG